MHGPRGSPQRSAKNGCMALAQVRTALQAVFTITGIEVEVDSDANAEVRAGLERFGPAYGVAIRGEAVVTAVPGVARAAFGDRPLEVGPRRRATRRFWAIGTTGPHRRALRAAWTPGGEPGRPLAAP